MNSPLHYARKFFANPRAYLNAEYLKGHMYRQRVHARYSLLYSGPFVQKCAKIRRVRKVAMFPLAMNHFQPAQTYLAWKVLKTCGAAICGGGERKTDLAFAWHPATQYDLDESLLRRFEQRHPVVNARCTDIRKSRVGQVFRSVFGYGLEIDPLAYEGTVLRKSERNGAHDARLLQGPLTSIEPGYVYQRCVDFETPKGFAEWRVYIVGARVVAAHVMYMAVDDRFNLRRSATEISVVSEVFSQAEIRNIERFASLMHLDFGALDVLRDSKDGRIYVCDCNNTPTGPTKRLGLRDQFKVVRQVTEAFEATYLS